MSYRAMMEASARLMAVAGPLEDSQLPKGSIHSIKLPSSAEIGGMDSRQLMEERAKIVLQCAAYHKQHGNAWSEANEAEFGKAMAMADQMHELAKGRNMIVGNIGSGLGTGNGRFSVLKDSNGDEIFAVGPGQSLTSVPGFREPDCEYPLGELVVAIVTGKRAGVSPDTMAAISRASEGNYLLAPQQYGSVIDLARAKSVLFEAGTQVIPMTGSELQIARVLAGPEIKKKFELQAFHEDTAMRLGGIRIFPKLIGSICTVSREAIDDTSNIQGLIEQELIKETAVKLDKLGLTGVGAAEEMIGLLNYPNIDSTPTVGDITWTKLASGALEVRKRNHEPNAAIMGTAENHALGMSTDQEDRWLGPPPPLQNLRRLETMNIPGDKAVVGDFSKFAMVLRTEPTLEVTREAGDNFKNHTVQIKLWMRADFVCFDETAFQIMDGVTAGA